LFSHHFDLEEDTTMGRPSRHTKVRRSKFIIDSSDSECYDVNDSTDDDTDDEEQKPAAATTVQENNDTSSNDRIRKSTDIEIENSTEPAAPEKRLKQHNDMIGMNGIQTVLTCTENFQTENDGRKESTNGLGTCTGSEFAASSIQQELIVDANKEKQLYLEALTDCVIEMSQKMRSKKMDFYIKEGKDTLVRKKESDVKMERNVAFCCALCDCTREHRKIFRAKDGDDFIAPSSTSLYHRRCCHNAFKWGKRWKGPYERACYDAQPTVDQLHLLDITISETYDASFEEIKAKYKQAKKEESEMYNSDGTVGTIFCRFLPFSGSSLMLVLSHWKDEVS
jgi:hypothetical protein